MTPRGARLRVRVPRSRRERMRGLLGLTSLGPDEAILFLRARSVHTFGMRFPVAVVHLGPGLEILGRRVVPPGRVVLPRRGARHVLECSPRADLRVGDLLRTTGDAAPA